MKKFKITHVEGYPILMMRCPRCHVRSHFFMAGVQQPYSGIVRILLYCSRKYGSTRQCGHIIPFEGVIK